MSFLDDGFLGDADPGLGINFKSPVSQITNAFSDAGKSVSKVLNQTLSAPARAVMEAGQQTGGVFKGGVFFSNVSKEVGKGLTQATLATGKAFKDTSKEVGKGLTQATLAVGTAAKQAGVTATDALKLAAKGAVGLISKKGGRVVDEGGGPVQLIGEDGQPIVILGWSIFADPAVPGEPSFNPGTDAEKANPAWPGYFATKGSERIGPYTFERVQSEILGRPAPALDASGTQATWEGWAFWMIPATPGDTASEGWPGYFAEKAGTRTNLGTADAVMKDVQARETKNAPDQEFPPGETNPYLGWALWWRPSEGDAGIYGKKGDVETVHGTADAVALDIQNREKATQPQTPSGFAEAYSGQDYQGWQIWTATVPQGVSTAGGVQSYVFGLQGSTRTTLYPQYEIQQLYLDIQQRSPQQPQPGPYQPDPYQPSPYQPSPYQPSPYQPSSPMTGGGGSFTPSSGGGFGPSSGSYGEGGFLSPSGNSGAADGGMPGADARESDARESDALYPDDASEEAEAEEFEDAESEYEDAEYEDSDLDEAPRRSRAIDGLGATPSLPSAILPLAGVALLWYLVTRK
jgi:hypothetical protein